MGDVSNIACYGLGEEQHAHFSLKACGVWHRQRGSLNSVGTPVPVNLLLSTSASDAPELNDSTLLGLTWITTH